MWRRLILAVGITSCMTMTAGALHPAAGSCNEFCFSMLDRLPKERGNVVFSPVSVWSSLTLMAAGTEGETHQQMHKALSLDEMFPKPPPLDPENVFGLPAGDPNSFAAEWLDQMKTARGTSMKVSNRIWAQSGLAFRPVFQNLATKSFGTGIDALDFSSDAAGSARRINVWAAESTRGGTKELLTSKAIRPDTRIIVASTFGFDGKWAAPFDARKTTRKDFTRADGSKEPVEMMIGTVAAGYLEDDRMQALRLRFQGMDASMVVVLPKKTQALEGKPLLDKRGFMLLLALMRDEPRVAVELPRFRLSIPVEFSASLKALGMTRVFGGAAEMGRACDQPAMISSVLHVAPMSVSEGGVASGGGVEGTTAPAESGKGGAAQKTFIADRPFHFFVVDENFSGIALAGVIADPAN